MLFRSITESVIQQTPVSMLNPKARSSLAYEEIAATLMNKELNKNLRKRGMAAFFSHIVSGKKTG